MKLRIPLLLVFALLAAACQMRLDASVTINSDESGTFAIEMSADEEFRDLGDEGFDLTEGTEDLPDNWSVEPFVDGDFEGVRVVTSFSDLDDLNSKLQLLRDSADNSLPTDMFGGMTVTHEGSMFSFRTEITGLADGLAPSDDDSGFDGIDPSAFFDSLFQIRLVVTLPGEVIEHNADVISGSTMTWNISLDDEGTEFFATSSVSGDGLNPLVIVIIALVLAGAVFWFLSRRENEMSPTDSDEAPAEA